MSHWEVLGHQIKTLLLQYCFQMLTEETFKRHTTIPLRIPIFLSASERRCVTSRCVFPGGTQSLQRRLGALFQTEIKSESRRLPAQCFRQYCVAYLSSHTGYWAFWKRMFTTAMSDLLTWAKEATLPGPTVKLNEKLWRVHWSKTTRYFYLSTRRKLSMTDLSLSR